MNHELSCVLPGKRECFLPLLRLADESDQQVRSYMNEGDLYVYSPGNDGVAGIVLAISIDADVVELKAVAIEPQQQGQGLGTQMLTAVLDQLRSRGCRRVVVGTANSAIGQLAYYQKVGFRLWRIERDFFTPARGYPAIMVEHGIRSRDMVWLEMMFER